jgi:hypothetical protein
MGTALQSLAERDHSSIACRWMYRGAAAVKERLMLCNTCTCLLQRPLYRHSIT